MSEIKNLIKQLAEHGMVVDPKIFKNEDVLRQMLQMVEAAPKPKVKAEKRANNVREDDEEKKVDHELVAPGLYVVSFNLQMEVKDKGYTTKLVTQEYKVTEEDEDPKKIARFLAEKYIEENDAHLHSYSDDDVEIKGIQQIQFREKKSVDMREIPLKGTALQYKMFPADMVINKNIGQCVIDTIMSEACQVWPLFTRQRLIAELNELATDDDKNFLENGVKTRLIMAWAAKKKSVTCIAISPLMTAFESVIAADYTALSICFIVNNDHVTPIVDKEMKKKIAQTKKVDLAEMKFCAGTEDWCYCTMDTVHEEHAEQVIHVETDDLSPVLKEVILRTGMLPVGIMSSGPFVISFSHPETNQIYIASPDFLIRKSIAEKSFAETKYIGFVWANQSWAELFRSWTEFFVGEIPKSVYGPDSLMIRDKYPQSAYVGITREVTEEERADIVSFDLHKCYTSCLLENVDDFPVESIFDDVKEWTDKDAKLPPGKAYIARSFNLGSQKHSRGFFSSFFVQYAIDVKAITVDDVTHVQQASRVFRGNQFKKLVEKLMELFPAEAKKIINPGVGAWGRRYAKSGQMAITDSFEIALGMATEDKSIRLSEVGNSFWFMRKETKSLLHDGYISLREHIVCMGHIKLHKMELAVCGPDSEVIAYNTDSIKVLRPSKTFVPVDKRVACPGDICFEGKMNLRGGLISEMKSRPAYLGRTDAWQDLQHVEAQLSRPGMMVVGQPGFGKSYFLQQLYRDDKDEDLKVEKMTWTKTAALNISGETLDHVFPKTATTEEWIQKGIKYDVLMVDEYTIKPAKWFPVFYEMKTRKPSLRFRFFGDPQQLHAVDYDARTKLWYDYSKSAVMRFLVDRNRLQLKYQAATARYDADMKRKLDDFEENLTLAAFGERPLFTPDQCLFNIVKSAQKRQTVNAQWMAHHSAGHKLHKCGKLQLWEGMYLIAHENDKDIINATRYLVKSIGDTVTLETEKKELQVSFEQIANTCQYGYADTVMRTISRTIVGRFNIYEAAAMTWNEMFVALSRASTASNIGLSATNHVYKKHAPPALGEVVVIAPDLHTGSTYERTDGDFTYVGSTNNIPRRKAEHDRKAVSQKVLEWERTTKKEIVMNVLETYVISSADQLVKREYALINRIPSEKCMNTKGVIQAAIEKSTTKLENVEVTYTRFKIIDDEKEDRFRIRWRNTKGEDCSKKFSYKKKAKEDQRKAAEEFRAALVKEYFI